MSDEGTWVRAENVTVRCGECDAITETGVIEGPKDEHNELLICKGCGLDYTVTVKAEV